MIPSVLTRTFSLKSYIERDKIQRFVHVVLLDQNEASLRVVATAPWCFKSISLAKAKVLRQIQHCSGKYAIDCKLTGEELPLVEFSAGTFQANVDLKGFVPQIKQLAAKFGPSDSVIQLKCVHPLLGSMYFFTCLQQEQSPAVPTFQLGALNLA